jgi:outer membrane receptor for ferrienterochelin and colicin
VEEFVNGEGMYRKLTWVTLMVLGIQAISLANGDSLFSSLFDKSIEELINQEVTIATKSAQKIDQSPSVVSVITSDDIRNMGAREIEDVLRTIPGFELTRSYAGYYTIGVRGVKDSRISSKVLFLVDGIPFNQIFYGNYVNWGYMFNLEAIDKIEIIRGPGSALYGRNAFSAVVNIITKTEQTGEKLLVKADVGSFNHKSLSGFYSLSKEKLNMSVALKGITTDITNTEYNEGFGPAKWNLTRNNFSAGTTIGYGNFKFTGMFMDLNGGAAFKNYKVDNRVFNYALSYNYQLNSKMSFRTIVFGHNSQYTEDIIDVDENVQITIPGVVDTTFADIFPLGIFYKPQSKEYMYGIEGELSIDIASNNKLLVGVQADLHGVYDVTITSNVDFHKPAPVSRPMPAPLPGIGRDNQVLFEPGWFENGEHHYNNLAFFVQDIWHPMENAGITLGLRYDIDSEIGGVLSPRIGLFHEPIKNLNIRVLYGRAYRAPAPAEQYVTLGYAFGNKNLKPEIINTTELAVAYQHHNMSHSLSLFWNQLKDMIYSASLTEIDRRNIFYNIGKNQSRGIEYENKLFLGKKFYSYFNCAITQSVNQDYFEEEKDTIYNHPDVAPIKINAGVNYLFLKNFKINMNAFYRSEMERHALLNISDANGMPIYVQNKIGDYAIFNGTLQMDNLIKNLNLSFSVYNILNTKYYSQDNQHLTQPAQPGRQMIGSLTYMIQ